MLVAELLMEMIVRHQTPDGNEIIAFQDSIWILGDRTPRRVLRDVKRHTGLRGDTAEDVMRDARENRPDVLAGYVNDNTLSVDGVVSIALNPRSSLLIKKVVQQLGLDGVDAERMDPEGEEYSEPHTADDLEGRIPQIVYHGTTTEHVPAIMKIGIAPNENSNWKDLGKFADKVYLTASFQDAAFHANRGGGTPIVIATRIPDRNKIVLDFDVGATMHGITPTMDREGYTASVKQDRWDKKRVKTIGKYDKGTDYTREIGTFGYRGRIPSSFFTAFFVPDGEDADAKLSTNHAIEIKDKATLWRALEMIDEFGYYDPSYQWPEPDEDDDYPDA